MSVATEPQTTLKITNLASLGGSSVVVADPSGYDLTATVITVPANSSVVTQVSPDYFVNVTPQLQDLVTRGLITYSGGTGSVLSLYLSLANLVTTASIIPGLITLVPGVSGRLVGATAIVDVAGVHAAASAPLQLFVTPSGGSNTPCTGGLLTLTLANTAAAFDVITSTAVTAGGTFGPADTIGFNQGVSTEFTAGAVNLCISIATI